ncbi:hypothetical protein XENOCAPTIV_007964 [Xenoophorus captivus]|uniref:Uncharacterized protein n=1 Tax=Xenoophorus captivus TaxID=1517983 RepID=A0ABV0SES6_9TELE
MLEAPPQLRCQRHPCSNEPADLPELIVSRTDRRTEPGSPHADSGQEQRTAHGKTSGPASAGRFPGNAADRTKIAGRRITAGLERMQGGGDLHIPLRVNLNLLFLLVSQVAAGDPCGVLHLRPGPASGSDKKLQSWAWRHRFPLSGQELVTRDQAAAPF